MIIVVILIVILILILNYSENYTEKFLNLTTVNSDIKMEKKDTTPKPNEYSRKLLDILISLEKKTFKVKHVDQNTVLKGFINLVQQNSTDLEPSILESIKTSTRLFMEIPLYIYEKKYNFVTRLKVKFITTSNLILIDEIKILDDTFDKRVKFQLPAVYINDNNRINNSNGFFKIENSLGLFYPYATSADDIQITQEDIQLEKERQLLVEELNSEYTCFGVSGNISNEKECKEFEGTWDKPVKDNYECPFYKANKNYTNERGGVNLGGYCEMPSGVQIIGYRHFDKNFEVSKPKCYNCDDNLLGDGTLGYCCDTQLDPDYKFDGDTQDRKNAQTELNEKNLKSS